MAQLTGTNGEIIELPLFGCYSGCAQDYCFIFGKQIPSILYLPLVLLGYFLIGFIPILYYYLKEKKTRISPGPKLTTIENKVHDRA